MTAWVSLGLGSGRGVLAVGFRGFLGGKAFFLATEGCGIAFAFFEGRRPEAAWASPESIAPYLRFPEVDEPADMAWPFGMAVLERSEKK